MSSPADWITPAAPEEPHECTDPGCTECSLATRIADAGARALCASIGIGADLYDDLGQESVGHYRLIASEVMAAMSEAMLALDVVAPRTAVGGRNGAQGEPATGRMEPDETPSADGPSPREDAPDA